ncbi:helix-turn-helix transcriptional regulator [Zhihengliuella flava]|uniref:DNA-binding CsgD family transcriptional regulator n=1 Tax=Zhihengliuella flava TaxID=1285193 RepID=A0A931DE53_9MICC|nr:helix-turn-helix transcriptional regulator [Zhihengliuella flava]MBG6085155.1 DNA-binding CsgD family transcriptional regulator [Zhihengliuella flava]
MQSQTQLLGEAIEIALSPLPAGERRLLLGDAVRQVLEADVFVSYVWDDNGPYADPVEINLGRDMVRAYAKHYRYVDTLTPELARRGRASAVSATGDRDEFTDDFLHRRDMFHGINYFPAHSRPGSVDLRLWRGQHRPPFTDDDVRLVQAVGDLIGRVWPLEAPASGQSLTPRQRQIAELVAQGLSDQQICRTLGIALPTLRTHLTQSFQKTGARSRTELAGYVLRRNHP